MSASNLKILFVINPISGSKNKIDWEPEIRKYFLNLLHSFDFFLLDGKDDATSLKYWIEKLQPERVIAVGGDGTVSLVAEQLLGKNIAMGILPAGSANGMARELNIPIEINAALDIILNGEIKPCDVIRINDKEICLHLSDLGVNARLVKYFEQGNLRGKLGYALKIFKVLWRKRLMHVTIKTDKEEVKRDAFMVVIANASKYGTGALINPEGNLSDGLFEIVVVRKIAFLSILKMFLHFRRFNPKKVELFQAESANITTTRNVHFQVDGEYLGKTNNVKAEIIKGKLNLILPAKQ
ncbi:MAG: diacylglycerol kinase family lipid kinase [Bacteroidota bacterium]|nr:diacylglycerol kinase family lipid kinase [Bacteroidota bacterium]